jgi:hypothetical protein
VISIKEIDEIRRKYGITEEDVLNNQVEEIRNKYGNAINLKNTIKYAANHKELVSFSQKDYYTIEWMLTLAMKEWRKWEDKLP